LSNPPHRDPGKKRRSSRAIFAVGFVSGVAALVAVSVTTVFGSSSSTAPASADTPVVTAAAAMSVFGNPRTSLDVLPDSASEVIDSFTPPPGSAVSESLQPGAVDVTKTHRLLSALGKGGSALYAMPTKKGNVCFFFTGGPYGGCVPSFGGELPVPDVIADPDQYWSGDPTEIFGLAPDSVVAINVVVNGQQHEARLANNAYFYELSDATEYPTQLVVEYRDGTSATMDLGSSPPQQ